jgi:microtubule-associated protein-like 6
MQNVGTVDFGGILIRAIDVIGTNALVGCRNGNIYQVDLNTQSKQVIMESHSDGEVWGLAIVDQDTVVTTGDDNQIKAWSVSKRQCVSRGIVSSLKNKVKRGGASSLTQFPDSQCARAIAYCPQNGHIAVGHNDGTLTVRESIANLDSVIATNNDAKEWIEDIEFSPDGFRLAVGSHDNKIYIYDTETYSLIGKITKHNSFIVSVDWSADAQFIRSVCGAHELLFFDGIDYK